MRKYQKSKGQSENEVLATLTFYKEGGYDLETPDGEYIKVSELFGAMEHAKMSIYEEAEDD
ncbi:hypothetical protein [Salibacterium lacus]|uniref:Uncharacterized protein n=1 Tax=Salibacterium lacus TaxID=1898109 RepID=A0ABW5SXD7_9BACI